MTAPAADPFFDIPGWQAIFERESEPPPDGCLGIIRRADFAAGRGRLLRWRAQHAELHEYSAGSAGDVAVLLVADVESVSRLRELGLAAIPPLVRQGKLHPYMLKTMTQLEDAGMMDFVEDLGLVFPKH